MVKGIITVDGENYRSNREVIFKSCFLFTDYTSKIKNIQIDNAT